MALLLATAHAGAQEALVGKYQGSFIVTARNGNTVPIGVDLNITSVDGGKVKATADVHRQNLCAGTFVMEGTYEGKSLTMRAVGKPKGREDCNFFFKADFEDNKLVGTAGPANAPLELKK